MRYILECLVVPPGLSLALLMSALLLRRNHRKAMVFCIALGLLTLYVAGIPATTRWLHQRLVAEEPVDAQHLQVQVILVLGGGRRPDAPEYGGDTLSATSLERVRYAAQLQKRTGLPLMVSGGSVRGELRAEAELMAEVLSKEFGAPVRWMETKSRDTFENARFSAAILLAADIRRIALVTHALHMARAAAAFRQAGIEVVPAPMGYYRPLEPDQGLDDWIPSPLALYESASAFHEIVGRIWYRWRQ